MAVPDWRVRTGQGRQASPVPVPGGTSTGFHGTNRQTFHKYYHRYQQDGTDASLLPQKRGPRWKTRRTQSFIEELVLEQRRKGINRYEIYAILRPVLQEQTPAPSTIYAISRRHGLNRLNQKMQQSKRQIIKTRAGELGHLDSHHLSRDLIVGTRQRHYLVAVLDACTRLAWAEVTGDIKSLSAMFAALKSINLLHAEYGIRFEALLTGQRAGDGVAPQYRRPPPWSGCCRNWAFKHRYTRGLPAAD